MSHQDYIAGLTEDQLICLMDMSRKRVAEIQRTGMVSVWTVSDENSNRAFFPPDAYEEAFNKMIDLAHKGYKEGHEVQWELTKVKMRPEEAEKCYSQKA